MIGSGQAYIPSSDQTPIDGIRVSDMIADDVSVDESGKVSGTVNYLSDVAGYEGDQKSGHYFPIAFTKENYKPLHVGGTVSGEGFAAGKDFTPSAKDPYLVVRIENCTDGNKVSVYDQKSKSELITLDFGDTTLAPPVGEYAFRKDKTDFGGFGNDSLYYENGKVDIKWDGTTATVTGKLKWVKTDSAKKLHADGNYFAFALTDWFNEKDVTVKVKNESTGKQTDWVCAISDTKEITVKYADTLIATFDLSKVEQEPAPVSISHVSEMQSVAYTADNLKEMKVAEIKSLATDLGYDIKATKKDDIITEFLEHQEM